MGRNKETGQELNLAKIFSSLKESESRKEIRVNLLPGRNRLAAFEEYLKNLLETGEDQSGYSAGETYEQGLIVVSKREEWGDNRNQTLYYAIFGPDGKVLPEPYAFATISGRYEKVEDVFGRIVNSFGGFKKILYSGEVIPPIKPSHRY